MLWFFNSNAQKIRSALRKRDSFYWFNVDAFARHPSPPNAVKLVPTFLVHGVWYVDVLDCNGWSHEALEADLERFKKIVRSITNSEVELAGSIRKIPGIFTVIETLQVNIRVQTSSLTLVGV
jgi:hypothetical protein